MARDKRGLFLFALILTVFCGVLLSPSASAITKNYDTCIKNARNKFKTNDDISPKIYAEIDDVSSGDNYGVQWACNLNLSAGVTWITGGVGQSDIGGGSYRINVNTKISRTATTVVGVTGSISGNTTRGGVYATHVLICAQNNEHYCWGTIGISEESGWGTGRSDFGAHYYLRTDQTVGPDEWTKPRTAFIRIDATKLLSATDSSGNKVVSVEENDSYGKAKLWIYRGFNGGGFGWSYCYVVFDKADKVANFTATSTVESSSMDNSNGHYKVIIRHNIRRSSGDNFTTSNSWHTDPTSGAKKEGTWSSTSVDDNKDVKIETIEGFIDYGSTVSVCSRLNYQKEIHSSDITKNDTGWTSRACKEFSRGTPSSYGEIKVEVYGDGYSNKIGEEAKHYNLSEAGSGEYKIVFRDHAKRNDNVGDQISFSWKTTNTYKTLTAEGTVDLNKSGGGDGSYVGSNQDIVDDKIEVSGVLKYGQTVTLCNNFQWQSHKHKYTDYVNTGTAAAPNWEWKEVEQGYTSISGSVNGDYCVTIYRPQKRCAIKTDYMFGIEHGENFGSVGVRNFDNPKKSDFSWTPVSTGSTHTVNYDDTNIWAMPGDSIQFKDAACAGAFYTIETNPGISNYGTHYSTAGWLATDALGTDGTSGTGTRYFGINDGYLFKDEANRYRDYSLYVNPIKPPEGVLLSEITAATPKPYATWTTGYNGADKPRSGFLSIGSSNPIAEMSGDIATSISAPSAKSPSTNNYDDNTASTYKVCVSDGTGCRLGKQDVGGSIVHQLTWNHVRLAYSSLVANDQHSATGIVRVPYNYYLEPYVENEVFYFHLNYILKLFHLHLMKLHYDLYL